MRLISRSKNVVTQEAGERESHVEADTDNRNLFVARVVNGKSFADVGGLWGTVNEKVSVAHAHGAREVTMIDVTPSEGKLWTLFRERMGSLNIANYGEISADICQLRGVSFDVVHCSGVLYHHPNPYQIIMGLREITREYLVLNSAITQPRISNKYGEYTMPPSGVLLVPALSESERAIHAEYWRSFGVENLGITQPANFKLDDFGPWWWLPTAESMTAMCENCGFEVLDAGHFWSNNAYTLLLKKAS